MRKIVCNPVIGCGYFTNIIVSDEKLTVTVFTPTEDNPTVTEEEALQFLDSHLVSPFERPEDVIVNGCWLRQGLEGNLRSQGKRTFFSNPPQTENTSTSWYGSGEICDRAVIAFFYDMYLYVPQNRTIKSYFTKAGTSRMLWTERKSLVAQLTYMFPGENITSDFNSLMFHYDPALGFRTNVQATVVEDRSQLQNHQGGWDPAPHLEITGPDTIAPEGLNEYSIACKWTDGTPVAHTSEIYLEATGGYLPKNRIQLSSQGIGTFKVKALALEAGEEIKVKAGWRLYTGSDEKVITVSNA